MEHSKRKMKSSLSSLDIHYLIKELQFLINGKIDKIYNPSKKELLLQFHVTGKGKQQLRINEKSIYLTVNKSPAAQPSEFCMYLRKKLDNSRLRKITQLGFERIIEFQFETKEEKFSLIFELFSKGNIILTKDNKILTTAEYQKWASRTIKTKNDYTYPKKDFNFLELKQTELKNLLENTNKESIVKSLAIDLGLGGIYAEEACLLAKIDKNKKPNEINPKPLFKALEEIKNKKLAPKIIFKSKEIIDIIPFELKLYKDLKQEKPENFSKALESYFSKEDLIKEKTKHLKQLEKIQEIIDEQKKHIKELEHQEKENKEKAELLYKNYESVSDLLKELKEISKTHSWKEIQTKLKKHKTIKEVIPKDKSIILEI